MVFPGISITFVPVMGTWRAYLNTTVAAFVLGAALCVPASAQTVAQTGAAVQASNNETTKLLQQLKSDDPSVWRKAQSDILREWSKSGSPAMDLLLERGRKALEANDTAAAIDHLTALIDHAPKFAEGYNMRAMAYYEAGLYGPALSDIGKALQLNPSQFGALAGLGMILEDSGFEKKALEAYKASAAIDPHQERVNAAITRLESAAAGEEL